VARAHLQAIARYATIFTDAPIVPVLVGLAGRTRDRVEEAARGYGASTAYTDARALVADPAVGALIHAGPNDLHAEIATAAAARGLHVLCEKPLARTASEAAQVRDAAARAGVVHMTSYNYRFTPAIVMARRHIEDGALGRIYHFRARFCDESMIDPATPYGWRHSRARAGSGSIGDLAAHVIDLARYLGGEIVAVSAASRIFVDRRPAPEGGAAMLDVDVEDAIEAVVEFDGGAVGTLEASTFCAGRKNLFTFEVNGERGSLAWNLERLNELEVYVRERGASGWRTVLVTDPDHPYGGTWWPPGHILGWEHAFVHQLHRFLGAIAGSAPVAPDGATFEDGYRCAVVCDALARAAREGRRVAVADESTGAAS
jgi:predicted dehydrogenase